MRVCFAPPRRTKVEVDDPGKRRNDELTAGKSSRERPPCHQLVANVGEVLLGFEELGENVRKVERRGDVEGGKELLVANLSDPLLIAVDVSHSGWSCGAFHECFTTFVVQRKGHRQWKWNAECMCLVADAEMLAGCSGATVDLRLNRRSGRVLIKLRRFGSLGKRSPLCSWC